MTEPTFEEMAREAEQIVGAIKTRGVCEQCGACSLSEASNLCKPVQDQTGEYSCFGTLYDLWDDQEVPDAR